MHDSALFPISSLSLSIYLSIYLSTAPNVTAQLQTIVYLNEKQN